MNLGQLLKKINEKMPDSLKRLLSPFIRRKLISNSVFLTQYTELEQYSTLSQKEKDEKLQQSLKTILLHAYNTIPFYKKVFDECQFDPTYFRSLDELKKIPIIDKQTVLDNFESMTSSSDITAYKTSTGGSSGKPLTIFQDVDAVYRQKAFVYHYWSRLGYNYKASKIASFRGVEFGNRYYKYNPIDNVIIMSPFRLTDSTVSQYIKKIESFGASYLHGYPSALLNLAKIMKRNDLSFAKQIEGVFFASENLYPEDQEFIEEQFGCKSLVFYGHTERAVFAEQIDESYSFNNCYGYTELIEDENGDFDIACTGFLNEKMPLIRYMPDDKINSKDGKLSISGHIDKSALIGVNNERITMTAINFHTDTFKKIKSFQFEQNIIGKAILRVVEDEEISEGDIQEMNKALDVKIKDILDVSIVVVDSIPLTKRGKFERIIQHIEHS
jgi:phenylacetate-CoA ligase